MIDYKHLFQQAPAKLLIVTPGTPYEWVAASDDYYEATLTSTEASGRPMFQVFPDNPRDPDAHGSQDVAESFERALASRVRDTLPLQKYDIPRKDGTFEERYWTAVNSPLIADDGHIVAIVHRVEDVTPLIQEGRAIEIEGGALRHKLLFRAEELARANRELHDQAEQRKRIAAIVAHDLRNPLAAMQNGITVLRMHFRKMGTPLPRIVDTLGSASTKMTALLSDLDDFSQVQLGGLLPMHLEWGNLRAVLEEVTDIFAVTNPRRVELVPGENHAACFDATRIRQVIQNLVSNALSYGARDRPVRLSLERKAGACVLSVANEGTPIPESEIPHLFEPFRRGPGQGRIEQRGHMGLGLYIVKQIADAHGATLHVASDPKQTSFSLYLPLPTAH